MEELHKFLTFSKSERIAIIALAFGILLLALLCWFHKPRVGNDETAFHNLDSLWALRQAALDEQLRGDSIVLFPFNPNTVTQEEGRRLGLADGQIRNIINYRNKGGHFVVKSDLSRLYTIGEEDYARLEPFIMLPDEAPKKKSYPRQKEEESRPAPRVIPHVELNTVDSATLVELPQIGPYIARRILEYRDKLGGYVDLEQLREVKDVDSTRFGIISPFIDVAAAEPRKIDVNRDEFRTLVRHPYLNYEQVKRIIKQREQRGMIKNWPQLESLISDEGEVNPLLEHYVSY